MSQRVSVSQPGQSINQTASHTPITYQLHVSCMPKRYSCESWPRGAILCESHLFFRQCDQNVLPLTAAKGRRRVQMSGQKLAGASAPSLHYKNAPAGWWKRLKRGRPRPATSASMRDSSLLSVVRLPGSATTAPTWTCVDNDHVWTERAGVTVQY